MSIDRYRQELAADPQNLRALLDLAAALGDGGDLQGAREACELAVALDPQCVGAWAVLGGVLAREGANAAALDALNRALALGPDCPAARWNRSGVRLLLGDYLGGWQDYEWGKVNRIRRIRTLRPEWDGKPLPGGKLLLWAEQGAGDTFQFVRFVKEARERSQAAEVWLEVPEALVPLLHGQVPAHVYAMPPAGDLPYPFDAHTSLMSLPAILGLLLPDVTGAPYLQAKGKVELPAADGLKVGLVWRGSATHGNDANRSLHEPAVLAPLLAVPGTQFYSFQLGHEPPAGVIDLAPGITDWTHTAALLKEMDLLISVDSGIVHLAGALGVPTWVLVPFAPDFRWLLDRTDSPWYDSVRLFRQPTAGDWESVIAQVVDRLAGLV